MDGLDVRILRAMGVYPYGREPRPWDRLRPAAIASRLGVSQERVKDRVRRMEREGIIAGYDLFPNHRLLGLEATCYYYQFGDDDAVDRAMARVEPLEGLAGLYAFAGGVLCVLVTHRSPADLERKLRLLVSLGGDGSLAKFYDLAMPEVHRPLSNLDWRILKALRGDARRPLPEVAKQLRVSARTVKRRFDRMGKEGSVLVVPSFDPSKAEGHILFYLMLDFGEEAGPGVVNAVHKAFDSQLIAADQPTNLQVASYALMLAARSMGEVEELRRRAAGVKGVARARTAFFRDMREDFGWLEEAIEERIKATAR